MYIPAKYNHAERRKDELLYDFNHMFGLLTKRWGHHKAKAGKKRTEAVINREFRNSRILECAHLMMSLDEIAEYAYCSTATVNKVLRKHNKQKKDTGQIGVGADKRKQIIMAAEESDICFDTLASTFGVCPATISRILTHAGVQKKPRLHRIPLAVRNTIIHMYCVEHKTLTEISKSTHVHLSTVHFIIKNKDKKRLRVLSDIADEVREYYHSNKGITKKAVCEKFNIQYSALYKILTREV